MQTLDTSAYAQQHLYKTLSKIKAVAEHPDLPPQVKKPTKASSDPATLNVFARLCKSNQAKAALDVVVEDVQQALGIESDRSVSVDKRRVRVKDVEGESAAGNATRRSGANPPKKVDRALRSLSGTPDPVENAGKDDDFGTYEGRIASSSDNAEDEFSDAEELEQRLLNETAANKSPVTTSQKYDVEADLSISGSSSRSISASPEPQKAATLKKASFLPSLTMGGYISGSESDAEDIDIAPKKNRRGQRARQQIWEQKFGDKAKHLQKQGHAAHWDSKRGAVDRSARRPQGRFGRERRGSPDYTIGRGPDAGTSKPVKEAKRPHRDDGGALHPSWEAAKKAKERKEAPVAFQGKKIVFD